VSPSWLGDAVWQPGRGDSRLLFMARPDDAARAMFDASTREMAIQAQLGTKMFPLANWHQSLSDRYVDTPIVRTRLLQAGDVVRADAFTLELDRLKAARNPRGLFNVEVRSSQASSALARLVLLINQSVAGQGLAQGGNHLPHVTLSYAFDRELRHQQQRIRSIEWTINSFELVVGGGDPYVHQTLGRWPLAPTVPHISQSSLF